MGLMFANPHNVDIIHTPTPADTSHFRYRSNWGRLHNWPLGAAKTPSRITWDLNPVLAGSKLFFFYHSSVLPREVYLKSNGPVLYSYPINSSVDIEN